MNEEVRKAKINGGRIWEDLDDKAMIKKGEEYGSFLWEGDLIEGLGISTGTRSGVAFTNLLCF